MKKLLYLTLISLHSGMQAENPIEDVFAIQEEPVEFADSMSEKDILSHFESRYGQPEVKPEGSLTVQKRPASAPASVQIEEVFSVQEEPVESQGGMSEEEILSALKIRYGQGEKGEPIKPAPQPVFVERPARVEAPLPALEVCVAPVDPCETTPPPPPPCLDDPCVTIPYTLTARVSYFYPISPLFRDIYHCGDIDYQLSATIPLYQGCTFFTRGFNFWLAVDYFEQEGRSVVLRDKTTIQIVPVTAGFKWIYPDSCIRPYVGLGLKYYFLQVHNDSSYVERTTSKNAPGAVGELGVQFFLAKYFLIDLFAAYSYVQFDPPRNKLPNVVTTRFEASSINVGGGIGFKF